MVVSKDKIYHDLISIIKESKNIRQTLIKSGLTPKGMNYERVRTLMFKNNVYFLPKKD